MSEPSLFPDLEPAAPFVGEPVEKLSAGRRLTLRQRADVDRGIHPLTGMALLGGDETCGSCAHRSPSSGTHSWPKCDRMPIKASAANDCRAWWPACSMWLAKLVGGTR